MEYGSRRQNKRAATLADVAAGHGLIVVRCTACCVTTNYLATDLVAIYPERADLPFDNPVFGCSRCKTKEYIKIDPRYPYVGDHGSITVRRPGPVRRVQTWADVKLGEEPNV